MATLDFTDAPDPDTAPLERAVWRGSKIIELDADEGEEPHTQLADVLADLMHWAESQGVDFDEAYQTADVNRQEEMDDWAAWASVRDDR